MNGVSSSSGAGEELNQLIPAGQLDRRIVISLDCEKCKLPLELDRMACTCSRVHHFACMDHPSQMPQLCPNCVRKVRIIYQRDDGALKGLEGGNRIEACVLALIVVGAVIVIHIFLL